MERELWFSKEEYLSRVGKLQNELRSRSLDAFLAFHPESVTYLTGFFTKGYFSLQFAIVPADGEPLIVCRDIEEYYLDRTGVFPGRVLWSDGDDPMVVAARAIGRVIGSTSKVGVEMSAWMLNARRFEALKTALPRTRFVDESALAAKLRWIKSPAEIAYQKAAARIAETGMTAAIRAAMPGATERDVAAAVTSAMILAGNDGVDPGPIASGERALHVHGGHTDRTLQPGDTLHVECCPHVRRYHARFMRSIKVKDASLEERTLASRLIAIQDRALDAVRPGVPARIPDEIYRSGILETGAVSRYTNKTFYSVGLMLYPVGESLEAGPGSNWVFESGMTFHTYLIVKGLCVSETILVTPQGHERLTTYSRELLVS